MRATSQLLILLARDSRISPIIEGNIATIPRENDAYYRSSSGTQNRLPTCLEEGEDDEREANDPRVPRVHASACSPTESRTLDVDVSFYIPDNTVRIPRRRPSQVATFSKRVGRTSLDDPQNVSRIDEADYILPVTLVDVVNDVVFWRPVTKAIRDTVIV